VQSLPADDEDTTIGGLPLKSGAYGFTPQFEHIGDREFTHLEDSDGRVILGDCAGQGFWGVIDPDQLTDDARAVRIKRNKCTKT